MPPIRLILVAVLASAALAACAADDGGASPGPTHDTTPAPNGPATAPADDSGTVDLIATTFEPEAVVVPRGGTVTWHNQDQLDHTVTHGTGGDIHGAALFDMPLPPGQTATYTFAEAGSFPVTCRIHPQMQMDVTVSP